MRVIYRGGFKKYYELELINVLVTSLVASENTKLPLYRLGSLQEKMVKSDSYRGYYCQQRELKGTFS